MKAIINCMQCLSEQGFPSEDLHRVEIRDDGLYESTCKKGHTTLTVNQQQKFEILFDFGASALLDGYSREAITSIAASLERFYEFYVTVICFKHGIDLVAFQHAWKHVSNQSERQFGAYIVAYLIDHNDGCKEVPVIDNCKPTIEGDSNKKTKTWKEFRNTVVHKGYIPYKSEVIIYGNIVYNHIYLLLDDLKERSSEAIQKVTSHHIARANKVRNGKLTCTSCSTTLISLTSGELRPESFEKALEDFKTRQKMLDNFFSDCKQKRE